MVEEIWQELSKAKYIEWEGLSRERATQLHKLKVACQEAIRNYNSHGNPAADAPEEQLNELEEVFRFLTISVAKSHLISSETQLSPQVELPTRELYFLTIFIWLGSLTP
uniref:TIDP9204 n=1 Tax=Arundo donax TaxID=35708 RepID=A0A0A9BCN8_ARUDO